MDLFQFVARFHVLVLHLPIGILMLAALLETHMVFGKSKRPYLLNVIWFWGAISATGACVLGWMLSQADGYAADAIFIHRSFGISVAVIGFVCWWLFKRAYAEDDVTQGQSRPHASQPQKNAKPKLLVSVLSGAQLFFLFATGHYGANMTHGETYLVEHAPNLVRAVAGFPPHKAARPPITSLDDVVVYDDLIAPMLEQRCASCHNDSKQKGKLNLANMEAIVKGGTSSNTLVIGDADASELYKRITLNPSHKEFMPAEGKPPLSDDQVAIIKWWINAGAPVNERLPSVAMEKSDKVFAMNVLGLSPEAFPAIPAITLEQANALENAGFVVKQIDRTNGYLDLDLSISRRPITAETRAALSAVSQNIAYVNLSYATLSAQDMALLSTFTGLKRLRLEHASVDANTVFELSTLENLRYLNVFGSSVDDSIFDVVSNMPALEQLYLTGTNVTEDNVNAFKTASQVNIYYVAYTSADAKSSAHGTE
ncbi:c-type cytochrome domain-containing protein [Agaribacter marinus]|uniref:Cytochrome C Planctomycete-type domain-containing protein n=1 Tax=Agaribacter marinus TaxID=1431249 RepID=A0AA37SWK2_9ALTE|nr:c-type cytochrome domain-containing protein [Agaribacter marinus]GLR69465.1 hypothetical protein GCM10007852_03730 [Agaribacter marinus]